MTGKTQRVGAKASGFSRRCFVFSAVLLFSIIFVSALGHPDARAAIKNFAVYSTSQNLTSEAEQNPPSQEIPNIVHYVHIVPTPPEGKNATLQFTFRHFVSYYSAQLYLNPDIIYIHTNAGPELIQQARESADQWTRAVANLPSVQFHYEDARTETSKGVKIIALAHQSDFIRTKVMRTYGGIYVDEDIYILKDLADLRRSGFQTIVGLQQGGDICNGMFLGMPGSELIKVFDSLQDGAFDGGWTTHSVSLLSRLVGEFAAMQNEVLILDQKAFFALSWDDWGTKTLYETHEDDGKKDPYVIEDALNYNATSYVQNFKFGWQQGTWRFDWRVAYAVHGWNSGTKGRDWLFGKFGKLNLEYVLAQNSNFARAVYPAVKHALDRGVIANQKE